MIWDARQRRYEDENGRPLKPAEVRQHIEDFIVSEREQVRVESARLFDGEITSEEFFAFMRRKIAAWHGTAGMIAYGGKDQMNA
jgi:hypothetical protein